MLEEIEREFEGTNCLKQVLSFTKKVLCYVSICLCVLFLIAATKGLGQLKANDSTGDKTEEEQGIYSPLLYLYPFAVYGFLDLDLAVKQMQRDRVY